MDMSKLPRMSQTPPPPPSQEQPPQENPLGYAPAYAPAGGLAEAWISIAIGVILLFATTASRFIEYLTSSKFSWTFTDETGAPLPYRDSVFFWGDVAMFAFAVVLIADGLTLLARRVVLMKIAFILTLIAIGLNLLYAVHMMSRGYGFQLWSALAVAFGVYIALHQWRVIAMVRASSRHP